MSSSLLQQATRDDQLGHRHARVGERLDDHAGAERGGLHERAVDVLRRGWPASARARGRTARGRRAPTGCRCASPARCSPCSPTRCRAASVGQVARAARRPLRGRASWYSGGTWLLDEPREDVADAALPRLVPPQPRHDPAVDDAAHAGHLAQLGAVHHVAGGRAHDRDEPAGLDRLRGGRGDVRVDVADRDRDALRQAGPVGGELGQVAGAVAELADGVLELVAHERRRSRGSARGGSPADG